MCTQKMRALSYIGAEKITFTPKPDIQTGIRTDISVYRVASLLKRGENYSYYVKNIKICFFIQNLKPLSICA